MSVHKYNSWGRTRRPKNVAGPDGTEAVTSTSDPSAATDGYSTENQRYLHLVFKESQNTSRTIKVFGYFYGAATWVELNAPDYDGSVQALTIVSQNDTTHRVYEILGVDRVYFQASGALHANDALFALCSTF
tara:strand:+ start:52 stop:447 length:396 start_codon:yes stop_codon:yes gene_type:complete